MADASVASVLISDCAHVHPDHQLELVLERLGRNPGILPVVSRSEANHILGVITPERVLKFLQNVCQDRTRNLPNGGKPLQSPGICSSRQGNRRVTVYRLSGS
jgi:hypothetical protein